MSIENVYFGGPKAKSSENRSIPESNQCPNYYYLPFDNISTDEIIPVNKLLTPNISDLGNAALVGLRDGSISEGALKQSGKTVLVAGSKFGKGSSREQAVWALKKAGIQAVIAPSFGPIFENNATNLGLLTSNDMSIVKNVNAGKPIKLEVFLEGKSLTDQQIIRSGGLFGYLRRIRNQEIQSPTFRTKENPSCGMTIWEKRVAKQVQLKQVLSGDSGLLPIDAAYSYVGLSHLAEHALNSEYGNKFPVRLDPQNMYFFEDHFPTSMNPNIDILTKKQQAFVKTINLPSQNYISPKINLAESGICHKIMLERVNPAKNQVVLGTDSHTPTLGALPILPIPVGSIAFAAAIAEGNVPYTIPQTTRVEFTGALPSGVSLRDVQLTLAKTDLNTSGHVIEFGGKGLNKLNFDQVCALCNMVPEVFNGLSGVTESFDAGIEFVSNTFNIDTVDARNLYNTPDTNAKYSNIIEYDLSKTIPHIALPGSPNNTVSLLELNNEVHIDKAFLVSCTLGLSDFYEAAAVLKNRKIHVNTSLVIVLPSQKIRHELERQGVLDIFRISGAKISDISMCGPCIGQGEWATKDGETAITASNRNFPGRMGSIDSNVYMGSTIMTTLSSLYGEIPTPQEYKDNIKRISENLRAFAT